MHRVFFDSNTGGQETGYPLIFDQSLKDLALIEETSLKEGLHVIIYMPHELEAEAELFYDREFRVWRARPVSEFRMLPPADG